MEIFPTYVFSNDCESGNSSEAYIWITYHSKAFKFAQMQSFSQKQHNQNFLVLRSVLHHSCPLVEILQPPQLLHTQKEPALLLRIHPMILWLVSSNVWVLAKIIQLLWFNKLIFYVTKLTCSVSESSSDLTCLVAAFFLIFLATLSPIFFLLGISLALKQNLESIKLAKIANLRSEDSQMTYR